MALCYVKNLFVPSPPSYATFYPCQLNAPVLIVCFIRIYYMESEPLVLLYQKKTPFASVRIFVLLIQVSCDGNDYDLRTF